MAESESSPRMRKVVGTALGFGGLGIAIVGMRNLMLAPNPPPDEATPLMLGWPRFLWIFLPSMRGACRFDS